jgi:hypothetical protein
MRHKITLVKHVLYMRLRLEGESIGVLFRWFKVLRFDAHLVMMMVVAIADPISLLSPPIDWPEIIELLI